MLGRALPAQGNSQLSNRNAVGVGLAIDQEPGYSLVIEGHNHFSQKMSIWGVRQYGYGQSRLELGSNAGINLDAISGITVMGLEGDQGISPHLGIEPFNGHVSWNSNDARQSYYQWFPMLSGGIQVAAGSCRFLPLMRGGFTVGNLGKDGLGPRILQASGIGVHLNCAGVDLGANLLSGGAGPSRFRVRTIDFAVNLRASANLGVRSETLTLSSGVAENRYVLVIRSNW